MVDYSATKGAILTFTRSLSVQLAPKGIRVNTIAPGPVYTALQPASRSADQMEGWGIGMLSTLKVGKPILTDDHELGDIPLHGRVAQPAEQAGACKWLSIVANGYLANDFVSVDVFAASHEANMMTGATIHVNSGQVSCNSLTL